MSSRPTRQNPPIAFSTPVQKATFHQSVFDALPDSAFIRESQLVQSPRRPDTLAPLPFSAPTLWRKVRNKTFPAPVKLSEAVTAWNVGAVRAWMLAQATASGLSGPECLYRPQHKERLIYTDTTTKERAPRSENTSAGPSDSQSLPTAAGFGDDFSSKQVCSEVKESTAALKTAVKKSNWTRKMTASQITNLRKKLTDALQAIELMEADSGEIEQDGDAAKFSSQVGGIDHAI